MTNKPILLDTFCKAGGCTKGYQRAGFYVVGVDIEPQPRYCGDEFIQADALEFIPKHGKEFDVIHASPPCQAYTLMRGLGKNAGNGAPDLIGVTRSALQETDLPYVIENVIGSPLQHSIMLCGSSFGLRVRRHRLFESNILLFGAPRCAHNGWPVPVWGDGHPSRQEVRRKRRPVAVYGDHPQTSCDKTYRVNRARTLTEGQEAMGIDWMEWKELTQAIPPAYTEWIGKQLMRLFMEENDANSQPESR